MLEITVEVFVVGISVMKRFVVDAFSACIEAPKALCVSENYQLSLESIIAITDQHHASSLSLKRASI